MSVLRPVACRVKSRKTPRRCRRQGAARNLYLRQPNLSLRALPPAAQASPATTYATSMPSPGKPLAFDLLPAILSPSNTGTVPSMRTTVLAHLATETSQQLDEVIGQVASALRKGGHKVSILGVHADLSRLISGLRKRKPDLIFNLMETFGRNELGAAGLAGVLNVLGFP